MRNSMFKAAVLAASLTTLCAVTMPAQADTVFGIYAGGNYWDTETSGRFGTQGLQQAFNFADDNQHDFYVALEHPVPLLPNIKIHRHEIESTGVTQVEQSFEFNNQTYVVGTTIGNGVELSHTDYVLYYELFDNDLVSLDVGVNGKYVDGYAQLSVQNSVNQVAFSGIIPTLYGQVRFGIPGTPFTLFGGGSFLAIDDNSVRDVSAGVEYRMVDNMLIDVNVNLGYRDLSIELDDLDAINTDLQFKGPFLGLELHF